MWNVSDIEAVKEVATVYDVVSVVALVLWLVGVINHIGFDEEDTLGSSVGYFDGITYEKSLVGSLLENILNKRPDGGGVGG